ncbi:MAG: hypothetical protein JW836_09840 [Deltaproteobacteria bacterium]|nr:hypothetical protein [Deltaproteobacteria bacterium]
MIIVLGGFTVLGCTAIFTGIYEAFGDEVSLSRLFIQLAGGLLFVGIGVVPIYVFFVSRKISLRSFEKRKKRHPDAPWMWVEQWSKKSLVYSGKGPVVFVWFVLSGIIAALVFVLYMNRVVILSKMETHELEFIIFFIVLSLILIVAFCGAVSMSRGHVKYGSSVFEMITYPGVIGGELAGTIQTNLRDIPKNGFRLELRCGYRDLKAKTGNRLRKTEMISTLWESEKKVGFEEATIGPQGVSFPISFSIPDDAKESDAWSWDKRIVWTLSASSSLGGTSYFSRFDVPVFRTGQKF